MKQNKEIDPETIKDVFPDDEEVFQLEINYILLEEKILIKNIQMH